MGLGFRGSGFLGFRVSSVSGFRFQVQGFMVSGLLGELKQL